MIHTESFPCTVLGTFRGVAQAHPPPKRTGVNLIVGVTSMTCELMGF